MSRVRRRAAPRGLTSSKPCARPHLNRVEDRAVANPDLATARAYPRGRRLHVVHREAFYSAEDLDAILEGRRVLDESPRRFRVKRLLVQ